MLVFLEPRSASIPEGKITRVAIVRSNYGDASGHVSVASARGPSAGSVLDAVEMAGRRSACPSIPSTMRILNNGAIIITIPFLWSTDCAD